MNNKIRTCYIYIVIAQLSIQYLANGLGLVFGSCQRPFEPVRIVLPNSLVSMDIFTPQFQTDTPTSPNFIYGVAFFACQTFWQGTPEFTDTPSIDNLRNNRTYQCLNRWGWDSRIQNKEMRRYFRVICLRNTNFNWRGLLMAMPVILVHWFSATWKISLAGDDSAVLNQVLISSCLGSNPPLWQPPSLRAT